jgi:transcriptional regulator with XRE-family HTH domain
MAPPSPTVASWELGLRLRQRRMQLGVDVKTITDALGFTRNYWSAIENDRKVLSAAKLADLLSILEFDDDERRELLDLREAAKQRGWWSAYSGLFSEDLMRMFGLEHGATSLHTYESLLIPGLLQTENYARALMTADPTVRPVEVDQRVHVRMQRQRRLEGDDPLSLTAIISQAALTQQIGGPAVLREQLKHLATTVQTHRASVNLHVIPFTATSCSLFGASTCYLFGFGSPRLPALAYQETVTATGIIDGEKELRDLSRAFADALAGTLSTEDSLDLINQCAREMT